MSKSLTTAFGWIVVAYVIAISVGVAVAWLTPAAPIWQLLAADIAATIVIFGFSVTFRNASFYDAYWSVIPPLLGLFWLVQPEADGLLARQALVMTGVSLWAIRLTVNWARGWTGVDHEDWRYVMLSEQTGRFYPLVNFSGIHVFPTIQVFLASLPLWPALTIGSSPIGWLDAVASIVLFGAVAINHVADEQLRAFRCRERPPEALLEEGLWSWSRHPNYFGEMGFWWGVLLFGLAADTTFWWTGVGATAITAMFIGISIPMIERRMVEKRPRYREIQQRVSMVIPLPPRTK